MPYLSRLSNRLALRVAGATLLVGLAACATDSSPVAPKPSTLTTGFPVGATPVVNFSRSGQGDNVEQALKRAIKLKQDVVASIDVDSRGGVLVIPAAGATLIIPPFAVLTRTHITVTARAGSGMLYKFEPHGLSFGVPLLFEQDVRNSSFVSDPNNLPRLAYFDDSSVDLVNAVATALEHEPSAINFTAGKFYGLIPHFSGYMVSSARKAP